MSNNVLASIGGQQAVGSSTNYADPGSLDPSLLSQSVPAVYHRFQSSQMEMLRKKAESEHQFGSFLSQYSGHANGPMPPSLRSPLTGPQAEPFASIHTGYHVQSAASQFGSLPRPLPYVSPTQTRFGPMRHTLPRISQLDRPMNAGMASSFPIRPEASRYPVGSLLQENSGFASANVQHGLADATDNYPSQTRYGPETLTVDTSGPSAQVIKPKKKVSRQVCPFLKIMGLTWKSESFESQASGVERKSLVLRGRADCKLADIIHLRRGSAGR